MDTDKLSIRNAFAAGITTGTGNVLFFHGASLNRRQIATFIYRALMYVRDNSGIRYTIYDSPLKNYTDSKKIASWATDLIEFPVDNASGGAYNRLVTTHPYCPDRVTYALPCILSP